MTEAVKAIPQKKERKFGVYNPKRDKTTVLVSELNEDGTVKMGEDGQPLMKPQEVFLETRADQEYKRLRKRWYTPDSMADRADHDHLQERTRRLKAEANQLLKADDKARKLRECREAQLAWLRNSYSPLQFELREVGANSVSLYVKYGDNERQIGGPYTQKKFCEEADQRRYYKILELVWKQWKVQV